MRVIVHGVGAIGGTIAAELARAGQEVVGIARGRQLEAIRDKGLTVRTPELTYTQAFDCVGDPAEIAFRPDDAILLTVKGQDTEAALGQLRAAGVTDQPIFCAQNGVENERRVLRRFPNVHGVTVMLPADYVVPGEVAVFAGPKFGLFEIGRFPGGVDAADEALVEALGHCNFAPFLSEDVMRPKYGKLLMNLRNISGAALGEGAAAKAVGALLIAEGEAVLRAAGIDWQDVGASDPRRKELMQMRDIPGVDRVGSSTAQSLARNVGSIETDFLNGEIVVLGRLHGVATPANDYMMALAARMLREGLAPGSIDGDEVKAALGL